MKWRLEQGKPPHPVRVQRRKNRRQGPAQGVTRQNSVGLAGLGGNSVQTVKEEAIGVLVQPVVLLRGTWPLPLQQIDA
jgi:hypothetical protein